MTQVINLPLLGLQAGFRRFSVKEYHRLIQTGILNEDDNLELIEGYLVKKMTRNPPHDSTLHDVLWLLKGSLPGTWDIRVQSAVSLPDSQPEPDLAIVRKDPARYRTGHPTVADIGLVIEVSDATLAGDRVDKGRMYSRAGVPCYWIVNIPDRQIEVYTLPSGPTASPTYGQRQDFRPGDVIPLVLAGVRVAEFAVQDLIS